MVKINIFVKDKRKPGKPPKRQLLWGLGPVSEQRLAGTSRRLSMLQLTNTQQCPLSIAAVDRKGNAARVDAITFASSDPNVATVTQDTNDPTKALLKAVATGTAQIQVSADADLGDGVNTINGTLDVTVVAGQAVGFTINAGTPEEQPE